MDRGYLIIVKRDEGGIWIVDEDSCHILEDEGGNPVLELQVQAIRALRCGDRQHKQCQGGSSG